VTTIRKNTTPQDTAADMLGQAEEIILERKDEASALAQPDDIDQTWHDLHYKGRAVEQSCLFTAEGEVQARPASEIEKAAEFQAAGAMHNADQHQELVDQSSELARLTERTLKPYSARSPHASRWYLLSWILLFLGDAGGAAGAFIMLGDYVYLALMQAASAGIAAVIAGKVGQDLKEMRLCRRYQKDPGDLSEDEKRIPWFFHGSDSGEPLSWLMVKIAAAIFFLIPAGIFALRSLVDGSMAGMVFGFISAAIVLGSCINTFAYADLAQDKIDKANAEHAKTIKDNDKLRAAPIIADHARAQETARSIRFEYAQRAIAAEKLTLSLPALINANNPQVTGHGPAAHTLFPKQLTSGINGYSKTSAGS